MEETHKRTLKGCGCILAIVGFVLFFFMAMMGAMGPFEVAIHLLFGWVEFMQRTVPHITWNWELIITGIFCLTLVLIIAQWLLGHITKHIADSRGTEWQWPLRWTCCGAASILIFFLVGMAVGGIVHQVGWISSSPDPLYEVRTGESDIYKMKELEMAFQTAMMDKSNDLQSARQLLWGEENGYLNSRRDESPFLQRYHLLVILDASNTFSGTIIFPRNLRQNVRSRGMYTSGSSRDFLSPEKISELIRTNQSHLIAF